MNSITRRITTRFFGAAALSLWLAGSTVHAQTGGGGATGGGATGGGATGGGGTGGGGGGTGGGGTGGGGSGGGGGLGQGATSGTGARAGASGSSSGSDATNFLSTTYSNPLYMGRPNQASPFAGSSGGGDAASLSGGTTNSNQNVGGFGQPSFGTSTTARTTGTATTSSGLGRTGGGGGVVSFSPSTQAATSRIAYAATLKFATRPLAASTLQNELRDMLDRSSRLSNSGKIQVIVDTDKNVVVKGKVADDDERRLIEGMLRLTPGVRVIQNELTVE